MASKPTQGFHGLRDRSGGPLVATLTTSWKLSYDFTAHFHPYVQELMERLIAGSVRGLQEADTALPTRTLFSATDYQPTALVGDRPVANVEFDQAAAYGAYNWELFFHVPIMIAVHLSNNGRHEDAQRWFHYVFDPTDNSAGNTPERFWKTLPFQTTDVASIENILVEMQSGSTAARVRVAAWQNAPFRPHLVARGRPSAYMVYTVMAYLDNLIAWGDALFRQDTGEAIAEATQLYVLAANLLGTRPQQVPTKGTTLPQTYDSLRKLKLDPFSNALVKLENVLPFDQLPPPAPTGGSTGLQSLAGLGRTLYFCVPRNDKLIGYWDTVADRLFKIRNSLSLAGVFRQLPLFDPPIDPALLARAVAAGVDVAAVIAGANQPPLVHFVVLAAKTVDLCQESKSLSAGLLSAIEKQDGEALAALRARHEAATLSLAETIKYGQWQEAIKNREALEASLTIAQARYTYYGRQLAQDLSSDGAKKALGTIDALDSAGLSGGAFTATEPTADTIPIDVDIDSSALPPGGGPAGGNKISSHEAQEMSLLSQSQELQNVAAGIELIAGILHLIPVFAADVKPFGIGAGGSFGGPNVAGALSGLAAGSRGAAGEFAHQAGMAARIGTYARRQQEWQFQSNAAALDIAQINKQIRAAQIREFLAERDLNNHRKQIENAEEVEQFLAGEASYTKTTTTAYYALLRRDVRALYNRICELAVECARKAERALQNELGDRNLAFIAPSYLSGAEGLLAGEKLHLDVRRMELAYLDLNRREYELTQHVSLLQLDPAALIALRAVGRATFTIPEEWFDLQTSGHYFRRIRSVAVSVPCVAGPLTGVACTARMLRSTVRTSPLLSAGKYPRNQDGDTRFVDELGTAEAVVTSSGSNDSGMFETNLRDDRLLPFELRGAISKWQLDLPKSPRPFDYSTITDVVLHIRYTARDGGELLGSKASAHLRDLISAGSAAGSARLLSLRHEFPTAWAQFKAATPPEGQRAKLTLQLRDQHYPYWSGGTPGSLLKVDLIAVPAHAGDTTDVVVADAAAGEDADPAPVPAVKLSTLTANPELADWRHGTLPWTPSPVGEVSMYLSEAATMDDLYLLLTWKRTLPEPPAIPS